MVKNVAGGCNGKKVARKHTTKSKNELRLSKSSDEKYIALRSVGHRVMKANGETKARRKPTGKAKVDRRNETMFFYLKIKQRN